MIDLSHTIKTSGTSLWSKSKVIKDVKIIGLTFDSEFSTADVYFDLDTWNVETDGLIYTDEIFMQELRTFLSGNPATKDIANWSRAEYSEQGLQGANYINLDVDW